MIGRIEAAVDGRSICQVRDGTFTSGCSQDCVEMWIERAKSVTFESRSEIEKGLHVHATLYILWLPDLDSNQGPAD